MTVADTSIAAIAAGFSGFAALAAWRASREANKTAASVAQIERDRWHKELTPRLRFRIAEPPGLLHVRLDGPSGLTGLRVRLRIRDDRDRSRDNIPAGGPTAEERAAVVWGPFRFSAVAAGVDPLARSIAPFTFATDDAVRITLRPSMPPPWTPGDDGERRWRIAYADAPLRLWAVCEAPGHKPWRLSAEVPRTGAWEAPTATGA
ncbi:hypothetical protein [Streptomyces sp. AC602_WCS936]|uniref:hypothetical protein n=1 Tax=Streptomyces sp. AC602_WCS936 TaxID=2823685 RepID=UPI001C276503|nr:hypothetical protein [Streptomyces sp. AC602_WCS936]